MEFLQRHHVKIGIGYLLFMGGKFWLTLFIKGIPLPDLFEYALYLVLGIFLIMFPFTPPEKK